MEAKEGYAEARQLLEMEYGDLYRLSMVYIGNIHDWPVIKPYDGAALKKFAMFLSKCENAMPCMSYLSVLDHFPNILSVVEKFPQYPENK